MNTEDSNENEHLGAIVIGDFAVITLKSFKFVRSAIYNANLIDGVYGDLNYQDEYGNTGLHYLCNQPVKWASILISAGIDINIKNKLGQTALDLAVNEKNKELVDLLMETKHSNCDFSSQINQSHKRFFDLSKVDVNSIENEDTKHAILQVIKNDAAKKAILQAIKNEAAKQAVQEIELSVLESINHSSRAI